MNLNNFDSVGAHGVVRSDLLSAAGTVPWFALALGTVAGLVNYE